MNKEQAWKEWVRSRFGHFIPTAVIDSIQRGFEAGYEAARREDAEACAVIDMAAKYYTSQIQEMRLCEASRVFLKPNVGYFFTVHPGCAACADAEKASQS